jgi:ribose 5-phosphate isomerase B
MFAIGSDHGGYELKKHIIKTLGKENFKDYGTFSDSSCDYPDVAFPLAKDVSKGVQEKGILICRTGIGVDICANKVPGIRCALCYNVKVGELAKRHEDANIIAIPAEYVTEEEAIDIINAWTKSKFEGERHQRRIDKIRKFEEG